MILIGGLRNITKEKPNQQGFYTPWRILFKESFKYKERSQKQREIFKKWNWKRIYQKLVQ